MKKFWSIIVIMIRRRIRKSLWQKICSLSGMITIAVIVVIAISTVGLISGLETYDYVVETNAFFAPFEFYNNRKIVGVDVEIIDRVAKKLNAKIDVKNVEFDIIVDNVANGVIADAGAAGLTITPARTEKVNFSIPYYTSIQYVIFAEKNAPETRENYVVWEALKGRTIGSQTGCTGYLFASDEIKGGVLANTNTKLKGLDSHQLAADAINAQIIDYAIADELAAKFIVEKNPGLVALPLYYTDNEGDRPVEESYAIAVNKQRTELLNAFNDVLEEMLTPDDSGNTEMNRLILQYMGLEEVNNAE